MSSDATSDPGPAPSDAIRVSFDEALAGRRAEADGGAHVEGTQFGFRAEFEGTLTGRRLVQGDPPWHWLELGDLTGKPEDFADSTVWCEESFVYIEGA